MAVTKDQKHPSYPDGDERYKNIDRTIKRFYYRKDALLEVLNIAQETFGYLPEDLLTYVSQTLKIPLAKVYGVATFYQLFSFEAPGKYSAIVCTGTACHVKGSAKIVQTLSDEYHLTDGQATSDNLFSLSTARCVGSCGIAPVVVLNGVVCGKESAESILKSVQELLDHELSSEAETE